MHKVLAVRGNLGNKSAGSDLIKCAWPQRWRPWMGHESLNPLLPFRLDFPAQTVCGQNRWLYGNTHRIDVLPQRPNGPWLIFDHVFIDNQPHKFNPDWYQKKIFIFILRLSRSVLIGYVRTNSKEWEKYTTFICIGYGRRGWPLLL